MLGIVFRRYFCQYRMRLSERLYRPQKLCMIDVKINLRIASRMCEWFDDFLCSQKQTMYIQTA